jgi:Lipase (class 3)
MAQGIIEPKRHTQLLKGSMKNLFFPPEKDEFQYFAQAGTHPFQSGDTLVKASWAADASLLSYARYGSKRMDDQELEQNLALGGLTLRAEIGEHPNNWNASGTQAFFATADDFAILAFRGTEADDLADTRTDFNTFSFFEDGWTCMVHLGFHLALGKVWDQVHRLLTDYRRENPASEICLTGHSLGGALALLTYSRLSDPNISVYTFGCPRVGNEAFGQRVASNPGKGHFRFVNFDDVVTHVPLHIPGYAHAPQSCYRFDENGRLHTEHDGALTADLGIVGRAIAGLPAFFRGDLTKLDQIPAPPGGVDHSPARYCMRLRDCL